MLIVRSVAVIVMLRNVTDVIINKDIWKLATQIMEELPVLKNNALIVVKHALQITKVSVSLVIMDYICTIVNVITNVQVAIIKHPLIHASNAEKDV